MSPSSCRLVVSPVAVFVPPVALLPLAVAVLTPVAVVVPHVAVLPLAVIVPPVAVVLPLAVVPPITVVVPRRRVTRSSPRLAESCTYSKKY